jgi:hypothetical protein
MPEYNIVDFRKNICGNYLSLNSSNNFMFLISVQFFIILNNGLEI